MDRYELFNFLGIAAGAESRQEALRATANFLPRLRSIQVENLANVRTRVIVNDETIAEFRNDLAMGWADARPLDHQLAADDVVDLVLVNNTGGPVTSDVELYYTLEAG